MPNTIYTNGPGNGSGGLGTSPSPYNNAHQAMAAAAPGDTVIFKSAGGDYTIPMAWNDMAAKGGWKSGTSSLPINIIAENHTDTTTRGVSPGTNSVVWKPVGGGGAINLSSPSNIAYLNFKGFVFDASHLNPAAAAAVVALNNGANNIHFRNCTLRNTGVTSGASLGLLLEYGQSGATFLLNNSTTYCLFRDASALSSHFVYMRSRGSRITHCAFTNGAKAAIQLFAGSAYDINDNVIAYNWFYDFPDTAIDQALVLLSAKCSRNLIYRNEFWDCPTREAIYFQAGSGISGTAADNTAIHNTMNNIKTGVKIREGSVGTDFLRTVVKNNLVWNPTTAYYEVLGNGVGTIYSNNSTGADPLFTNAAADDFTLQAGSPYKTSGVVVGAPYNIDPAGIFSPQGAAPSIGSREYNAGLGTVPLVNVYPPAGFALQKSTAKLLDPFDVSDGNSPKIVSSIEIYVDGNADISVDASGGAAVS